MFEAQYFNMLTSFTFKLPKGSFMHTCMVAGL